VYSVNIIITLAAASDARGDILHGVENLAKLSVFTMQSLYDHGVPSSLYGAGTPKAFQGADKKDLLIVISVLDVCAMLTVLAVLIWFRMRLARDEQRLDDETATIDDYTAVVHGLPRVALEASEVSAHIEAAVPECKGCVSQVFVGKNFGEHLERLSARGALLDSLDSLDAQALATKKDMSKPRAKLAAKLDKLEEQLASREEAPLDEVEQQQLNDLRDATLAAESALQRLLVLVDDVTSMPATPSTELAARHSLDYLVQRITDGCLERGITVDLAERVSPQWAAPLEAVRGKGKAAGKKG
jgi:hypothetical protein